MSASTSAHETSTGSATGADGAPAARSITPGDATIAEYRDYRVVIQTNAPDRRLLVLTDVHYPGWMAAVDGRPAPLVRANFAFRGVPVPAGRHTVTFEYRSASLRLGLSISGAALAALMALAFAARRTTIRALSSPAAGR